MSTVTRKLVRVKRRRGEDPLDTVILSTTSKKTKLDQSGGSSILQETQQQNGTELPSNGSHTNGDDTVDVGSSTDVPAVASKGGGAVIKRVFRFCQTLETEHGEKAKARDFHDREFQRSQNINRGDIEEMPQSQPQSHTHTHRHTYRQSSSMDANGHRICKTSEKTNITIADLRTKSRRERQVNVKAARYKTVLNKRSGFIEMFQPIHEDKSRMNSISNSSRNAKGKIPTVKSSVPSQTFGVDEVDDDKDEFVYDIYYEDREEVNTDDMASQDVSLKNLEGYCVQVEAFEEDLMDTASGGEEYAESQGEDSNAEDYAGNDYPEDEDEDETGYDDALDLTSDDDSGNDASGNKAYGQWSGRSGRTGRNVYDSDSDGDGGDVDPYSFDDMEDELDDLGYGL
ncbi:hypothetical protein SARC_01090 [Sphaeroforma arctica JP610]|uniref:Probable RNA polymerase II nuclear localization protein SLC7A6OS n=1 Tax=Sphaeroforma arctica JP610 TaxID=667725 RepID=A0A0L0GCY8_9EUKA|nr:hypothetical protein SARC_01090 [Sphaeroforma arctica JP610]KNC86756.1 hypothetical protein SARC_01090 [Sphaeroforma arctica JP610]|eukprot:XP_014160658.1 hypothetical protein SARC_01090 [Sphaeroforma arctica JP610]